MHYALWETFAKLKKIVQTACLLRELHALCSYTEKWDEQDTSSTNSTHIRNHANNTGSANYMHYAHTLKIGINNRLTTKLLYLPVTYSNNYADTQFIIDSGATSHMANDLDMFIPGSLMTPKTTTMVRVGNGSLLAIKGKGSINVQTINSREENETIKLKHVLFVPTLQVNLFSGCCSICKRSFKFFYHGCQKSTFKIQRE